MIGNVGYEIDLVKRRTANEYSCREAPAAGETAYELRIDFDMLRWFDGRALTGIRALVRFDLDDESWSPIMNAIREIEARCEVIQ